MNQVTKIGASVTLTFLLLITSAQSLAQSMEFTPNFNNTVARIAIQADGKILVAGSFSSISDVPRLRLARLNSDGGVDGSFDPQPNSAVLALANLANGQIMIGGSFTTVGGVSGFIRNGLAKINSNGTVDASYNPNVNGIVWAILVQADGKVLIGGSFTQVNGVSRNRIARLNLDGSLDLSFDPDANDRVATIAMQPNGNILIGGEFTSIDGVVRNRVAQLDSAGTLDTNFDANANDTVSSIVIQTNGKILIGGKFTGVGQFVRWRLARLEIDGSLDSNYNPIVNGAVEKIALQSDGKVIAVGNFSGVSDPTILRRAVARFNVDGSLNESFNAKLNNRADGIALQQDGKIIVGGVFNIVAGKKRERMARLNADGSLEQLLDDDICVPLKAKNGAVAIICF
jgi:uncharacterized delta-60 repeat protein